MNQIESTVDAVIEIPMGSRNKYEYDEASGRMRLDRVLYSSVHYPTDYGFIPESLSPDGEPVDGWTSGLLGRRPISSTPARTHLVGNEGNKLLERQTRFKVRDALVEMRFVSFRSQNGINEGLILLFREGAIDVILAAVERLAVSRCSKRA